VTERAEGTGEREIEAAWRVGISDGETVNGLMSWVLKSKIQSSSKLQG